MVTKFKLSALALCLALIAPTVSFAEVGAKSKQNEVLDTIYTLSNSTLQNEVLTFQRTSSGMVVAGRVSTGGRGTGGGLGNQGALTFSRDGQYLFAVNPGSNDVSVFSVRKNGQLTLIDRAGDLGTRPVSVTVDHNRVYVLNAGDDSIYGYAFNRKQGVLSPLADSHKNLSGTGTAPAQISFDNEGEALVVTEKATNKITTFILSETNTPSDGVSYNSAAPTPFGFAFGKRNQLFVSEAVGGNAGASSLSSYNVNEGGVLELISGAVPDTETAACWVVITPSGRIAYTTNTGSSSISSYTIKPDGKLTLLQAIAAKTAGPTDLAMSVDGKILYALSIGAKTIDVFNIDKNGALTKHANVGSLPAGATGLVVR
jgi:6-phosphogluconolactonase